MKKLVVLATVVFEICMWAQNAAIAATALPLVATISSPDSGITGLAWDNGYLWAAFHYSYSALYKGKIIKFDMQGKIITSFDAPGSKSNDAAYTTGLAFDGTYLWNINYSDDILYKLSTSGEVIASYEILDASSGIAYDNGNLWVSNVRSNKIYKINPESGEILQTINAPNWENDIEPNGLAFDGSYLWVANSRGVYKITTDSGAIIETYSSLSARDGLTFDGTYLYSGGESSSAIKKNDVGANANSPAANAGADQIVFNTVTLDASKSVDADGEIVSYKWQLKHRENTANSKTAEGINPTVTDIKKGFYDVTLTVTDNDGKTGTGTMLLGVSGAWDINNDNRLGLSEAVYILQVLSGSR